MQITLNTVSYSYEGAPGQALGPITVTFAEGWTGMVGPNGSGKSTLLKIVCGQLSDFSGSLVPAPASLRSASAYCEQATEELPEDAEEFALDFSSEALLLRSDLGIDDDWIWRFATLSHGERKRLQIACALWRSPSIIALDEPTNHIDAATRKLLVRALQNFRGVGLLVSHDRELLDSLVTQCLFMRDGQGSLRAGNYSQGREQEQTALASVARERKAAKSELAQLATERDRRAHEAARADARRSKRHLNPKDRSAKAAIDLAIYSGQDGKAGRRSAQLDSRLKAAEQRVAEAFVPKTYDGAFWLDAHPSHRRVIARLAANAIPLYAPAGGAARSATAWTTECPLEGAHVSLSSEASHARTLFFPELIVGPTDHIGLSGPNGSGKSTLIRALVAALPDDLATLYLPQELTATETRTLLRRIKALAPPQRGQLLSLVARLNSDPDRILSGDMTSPGELRKLLLAEGALNAPQLIIADEPTNHLDLSSIEALEVVLAACPCALILVSHDAPFLAATTTLSWRIETEEASGSRLRVSGA